MAEFFKKLQQRGVFRAGGAYLIGAWVVLQVSAVTFPQVGLPTSAQTLVLLLVIAGLPAILLAAWHFDISFEGIVPEAEQSGPRIHTPTGRVFDIVVIVALLMIVAFLVWERVMLNSAELAAKGEPADKSIAVLAFADFTDTSNAAFLGDGISEEIINLLARSDDLKVTARTSSFAFRGENRDVREIADALEVSHVLEGSVRGADNQLRITAQLIDADTGFHIWSQTFDRARDDIFRIQDDIATAVLAATHASLRVRQSSGAKTNNFRAREAYQLGRKSLEERSEEGVFRAIRFFRSAVALDEKFATAHAALAESLLASSELYFGIGFSDYERVEREVAQAVDRALSLAPTESTVLGAAGLRDLFEGDPIKAIKRFEAAIEQSPNSAMSLYWLSLALEDAGRLREARSATERAYQRDPLARDIAERFVSNLILQRHFDEADRVAERLLAHRPTSAAGFRAQFMSLMAQARIADAHAVLQEGVRATHREARLLEDLVEIYVLLGMEEAFKDANGLPDLWIDFLINQGRCAEAAPLAELESEIDPGDDGDILYLGAAKACAGQVGEARALFEDLIKKTEDSGASIFNLEFLVSDLALMRLRDGDIQGGEALITRIKTQLDENLKNWGEEWRHRHTHEARIAVLEGRATDGIALLRQALALGLDAPTLRMEFLFASLREEPEYAAFINEYLAHLSGERTLIEQQLVR